MRTNRIAGKALSLLLAFIMLIPLSPTAFAGEDGKLGTRYVSRGQVCGTLLALGDDYAEGLKWEDIIKGYPDGTTREEEPVTRLECYVMISRAFGTLPSPAGALLSVSAEPASFSGVPQWAEGDLNNLINSRVVITEDGALDEYMFHEQMVDILRRIFKLKGSNLKDDFYHTVNKDWLASSVITPGYGEASSFVDVVELTNKQITGIISELASGTYSKGTKEQKIADLYNTLADMEARNAAGITPIKPYLEAIDAAGNMEELAEVSKMITDELAYTALFWFTLKTSAMDSTQYDIYLEHWVPPLAKEAYIEENGQRSSAWRDYMRTLLSLTGEKDADAKVNAYYEMGKTVSESTLNSEDMFNVSKTYNSFTLDQLQKLVPGLDLKRLLADMGFAPQDKYIVKDPGALKALAEYYTKENLELLKTVMKTNMLNTFSLVLSQDFIDADDAYGEASFGIVSNSTAAERASELTQTLLSDYLGELYVERYFSPKAKRDVEEMAYEFIDIFRERLQKLSWMNEETKQMALKKLDTMTVKIGYPDEWLGYMDKAEIKNESEGASCFDNFVAVRRANRLYSLSIQGQAVDKSQLGQNAFRVNASYYPDENAIIFPAGILQAPFYDENAPRESNLGGIGMIIAHEITHAFDNSGAKYDENGNAADWWKEDDYQAFLELCSNVTRHFDGYEEAPGLWLNGALTLSENIADVGCVACIIDAAKRMENPDWNIMFHNYALVYRKHYSRLYLEDALQTDAHSTGSARANKVLQNFEEFYEAYGITTTDAMYIAPEKRLAIW